jgi:hypothetical protein
VRKFYGEALGIGRSSRPRVQYLVRERRRVRTSCALAPITSVLSLRALATKYQCGRSVCAHTRASLRDRFRFIFIAPTTLTPGQPGWIQQFSTESTGSPVQTAVRRRPHGVVVGAALIICRLVGSSLLTSKYLPVSDTPTLHRSRTFQTVSRVGVSYPSASSGRQSPKMPFFGVNSWLLVPVPMLEFGVMPYRWGIR